MTTISISDLYPSSTASALASFGEGTERLIQSSVARAIDARRIVGGLSRNDDPNIGIFPYDRVILRAFELPPAPFPVGIITKPLVLYS